MDVLQYNGLDVCFFNNGGDRFIYALKNGDNYLNDYFNSLPSLYDYYKGDIPVFNANRVGLECYFKDFYSNKLIKGVVKQAHGKFYYTVIHGNKLLKIKEDDVICFSDYDDFALYDELYHKKELLLKQFNEIQSSLNGIECEMRALF